MGVTFWTTTTTTSTTPGSANHGSLLSRPRHAGAKETFTSYFSSQSGRGMRLVYFVMVVVVGLYTFAVVIDGVAPTCSFPRNRPRADDDDVAYLNPEFSTFGGCLRSRYWFLLGLTPEECMLCRRILLSVVLGMMIGFERRRADRPAGVRTMSLVSLGSCIFTLDSMFAFSESPDPWDSSRVAAAIPSGVGFLGAGLIWKQPPRHSEDRHEVHGLTTASSVWLSAAAGIAAGGGLWAISLFSTCVVVIVLRFGPRLPNDAMIDEAAGPDGSEDRADLESGPSTPGGGLPTARDAGGHAIRSPLETERSRAERVNISGSSGSVPSEKQPLVSPLDVDGVDVVQDARSATAGHRRANSSGTTGFLHGYSAVGGGLPGSTANSPRASQSIFRKASLHE